MSRTQHATKMAALLLVGTAVTGAASAQRTTGGAPPPDAPRFMVPYLHSPNRGLGGEAADAIRSRLRQDFSTKQLYVIQKNDQAATLEASGYKPDSGYDIVTNRLLANNLRADEFLDGIVSKKDDGGFHLESRMVLTRNAAWVQPLPSVDGGRLLDLATAFSKALSDARRQLVDERKCELAVTGNKNDSALAYARSALAAYPRSTLARICMGQALANSKASSDTVIEVTSAALKMDPNSRPALTLLADALDAAKKTDSAVAVYTRLLSLDPANVNLQQRVVEKVAGAGNPQLAIPIIDAAIKENPGDPNLLRLRFLLLLAVKNYKQAIGAGEELYKTDTAATDTTFFTRLAAAYAADSQPQKAAEAAARGVAKYPNNAAMRVLHATTLRQAGQTQMVLPELNKAIAIDPKVPRGYYLKALTFLDLNQPDSAGVALKLALANGEPKENVSQILLVNANKSLKHADSTKAKLDYQNALGMITSADSMAASPNSKLLMSVAAYKLGELIAKENQQAKSCDMAKQEDALFTTVQINAPQAAMADKNLAAQLIAGATQYGAYVQQQTKAFCK
ncbi:MAG: hypothetical protein M3068_07395 [Gemmatimonadota bacterium]|nr:hypothetical protein [Gemmatimonadota bacterium]